MIYISMVYNLYMLVNSTVIEQNLLIHNEIIENMLKNDCQQIRYLNTQNIIGEVYLNNQKYLFDENKQDWGVLVFYKNDFVQNQDLSLNKNSIIFSIFYEKLSQCIFNNIQISIKIEIKKTNNKKNDILKQINIVSTKVSEKAYLYFISQNKLDKKKINLDYDYENLGLQLNNFLISNDSEGKILLQIYFKEKQYFKNIVCENIFYNKYSFSEIDNYFIIKNFPINKKNHQPKQLSDMLENCKKEFISLKEKSIVLNTMSNIISLDKRKINFQRRTNTFQENISNQDCLSFNTENFNIENIQNIMNMQTPLIQETLDYSNNLLDFSNKLFDFLKIYNEQIDSLDYATEVVKINILNQQLTIPSKLKILKKSGSSSPIKLKKKKKEFNTDLVKKTKTQIEFEDSCTNKINNIHYFSGKNLNKKKITYNVDNNIQNHFIQNNILFDKEVSSPIRKSDIKSPFSKYSNKKDIKINNLVDNKIIKNDNNIQNQQIDIKKTQVIDNNQQFKVVTDQNSKQSTKKTTSKKKKICCWI